MLETKSNTLENQLKPFAGFSDQARVWIYQAARELSASEVTQIEQVLLGFVSSWTAHNVPLKAKAKVLFNRFIIISVDEEPQIISGCGIDKSVHKINEIETELGISLMDRTNMCVLRNLEISLIPFSSVSNQIEKQALQPNDLVFNTMVQNMDQLRTKFLMEFKESPFARLA